MYCFEKLMKDKFQMSSMRELTFFLGLQVQQKEDGIFISQDKYVAKILKKFNYSDVKSASTPVDLKTNLCQALGEILTRMITEGYDYLSNGYYLEEWTAKSTAWNEFSSYMASLIICLATNQKFNLSKYIFDAMVKHLDGGVKFLMFHVFSVFINHNWGDLTPSFITMIVQATERSGKKQPSKKAQRQEAKVPQDEAEHEESVPTPSNDPQPSGEDSMQLTDGFIKGSKCSEKEEIDSIIRPTGLKRLRKVAMSRRVESSKDQESLRAPKDASKQGRSIKDIDANVDVTLVDETQERHDDDLMFDTGVWRMNVMPVEA
ncbi:putative ribonuclease H-like domain-containing protein [Tanacetum coccineum]|uniref:Ribonuclease H-like domain-containing protein n=1 Tax=Tanacetum coccineum TaxID=301880 RepID=A0ABQ5ISR5_9ASTR